MNIKLSKPQQRIFDYMLQFGGITTLQAFVDLGESRLSGKIFDMKKKGINISSSTKEVKNRFGEKRKVKEYSLGGNYDRC